MGRIIIGIVIIFIGLSALTGLPFFGILFSILLIVIGVRIITGGNCNVWHFEKNGNATSHEDYLEDVTVFSSVEKKIVSEHFRGGKIVMVFSGGTIDLSMAKAAEKEIWLEIVAVFGGGKLIIPKNWNVHIQTANVFGGVDNSSINNKAESGSGETLNLKAAAVFGGIEIVNA